MKNRFEGKGGRRILSLALSMVMVLSLLPAPSIAAESDGLCEHHSSHTDCGYVAAVEGQECSHVCGEECYTVTPDCKHIHDADCYSDGELPSETPKEADNCTHQCTEESGCVVKTHTCVHTSHDDSCGYVETVAGQPCGFVCEVCAGEPLQAPVAGDKVVTAWAWMDEEEYLDEETGGLALPGASEEMPAYFADVVTFLPCEITATVDGAEETLGVDWVCDDYPETGAYEGEYIFTAVLPQGYVLAEGVSALTVNVLLGGGETYATVSQIPYLTFDAWKEELVSAQCSSATLVTSEDTKWTSGWYVVQGEVIINCRVEVEGDVNLILKDGCSLTVNGGIHVFGSNVLYIYAQSEGSSMGRLTAECTQNNGSGIGGNKAEEVGTIYIDGGNITATGHDAGAGIGAGGSFQRTGSTGGFIRICGGIVNATGGLQAAGIGGGPDGKGGRIYIFGGTVIAHNGDRAACIGDGTVYWDNGGCKISIIGDATVIADATGRGTGIGTYNKQISDTFTCGASSTGVAPVIITSGIGANYTSPPENGYSISDTGKSYDWKGLIFQGGNGTIYRMDSFTLRKDLTIPSISGGRTLDVGAGYTLTVASGKTLTIPSGVTLAVNGTLINNGNIIIQDGGKLTLNGNMTVAAGGSLTLNGTLTNTGSLVFQSGASVSGTGTYTGSDTSPSLQGAVVLEGKYLHIHKLVNDRCACGYSEYIFITVSGIKAANKVYDGTVNATLDYSGMNLSGVKAGDKVSVTATGTFGNKNAGANKTVTITNLTLTGADAGKYRLETTGQQTTATASITPKPVTAAVTVESKVYDGKNTAKVSAKVNSGLISGDSITITGLTGTFENANAGTNKTVTVNAANKVITGTGSGNYAVTIPTSATGTITKAQATITVEATKNTYNKTYGDPNFQLEGITDNSSDADVTYSVTEGADVVSVSDRGMVTILKTGDATITLSLPESTNYLAATSKTIRIEVAKKAGAVSITGNPGKTYDGQPAALTESMFSVTDGGGRTPSVEYKEKSADDSAYTGTAPKAAGDYILRVTLAETDNYVKVMETKDFSIQRKPVTVSGITAEDKTYDGSTNAELVCTNAEFDGKLEGDTLTVTATGAFENESAGENKTVAITGLTLGGASKGNYTLAAEGQQKTTTASILVLNIDKPQENTTAFTYTGSEQTYTLTESVWYTITGNTRTDAGSQTVTVALKDTQNTQWADGTTDDVTFSFAIGKAASSVTTPPAGKEVLYNRNPQELIVGGTTEHGTLHYSLDGENWSTDIPTAIDCGTYTVYYKVVGDSNHFDSEAQPLTAEIVPFQIASQDTEMTTTYGADTQIMVEVTSVKVVSYQWYQVTDDGDVPLEGETKSALHLAQFHASDTPYQFVCKITSGDYFKYSEIIPVTVTPAQLQGVDLSGYWAEGGEKETAQGETVTLTSPNSRLLTKYTTATNTQGDAYPSGMTVYALDEDNKPVEIVALGNLLQYSGCSIRITGKPGIRMITSLTKEAKAALKKGELAGYTLEEYGTVVAWSKELGSQPLTLSTGKSNYAYRKGVSDPVFANVGALTQYTNVLVWDELEDAKYAEDIVMRPYIKLSNKDGETVTLYGGTVSRSIGYVAQQNANTFPVGSAGYNYVHEIIDRVEKYNQSSGSTTTPGGNEG